MGKRDIGHRETKKVKKEARKLAPIDILPASAEVEVIRKKRKSEEEGER